MKLKENTMYRLPEVPPRKHKMMKNGVLQKIPRTEMNKREESTSELKRYISVVRVGGNIMGGPEKNSSRNEDDEVIKSKVQIVCYL